MGPYNTNNCGNSWAEAEKAAVWCKARIADGYSAAHVRIDRCGNLIEWNAFGDTNSQYGWEIDHIWPVSLGGNNHISNLQPLMWRVNRLKGDNPIFIY